MKRTPFIIAIALMLPAVYFSSCSCGGGPTPCTTNTECSAGQTCQNGVCTAAGACTTDSQCPSDKSCQNNVCVGAACTHTSECTGGDSCQNGFCALPSSGVPGDDNGDGVFNDQDFVVKPGCNGLECQQVTNCPSGLTRITGKVYTPKGDLPLYNAIVYVPNGTVQGFDAGVSCDVCGAATTGTPIATAYSGSDGSFVLENVPYGNDVPVVIQLGRWRRRVTIPTVVGCQELALTDPNVTRLPRNKTEGDIPKMAIATGEADPFECLLRKVGLDDAEISIPSGTGRVHYYVEDGVQHESTAPASDTLWASVDKLKEYDVVMLPCEGNSHDRKTMTEMTRLRDYTSAGGRVFTTHYGYEWIDDSSAFPKVATWTNHSYSNTFYNNPHEAIVDQSFQKGVNFSQWLNNVGASGSDAGTPNPGKLYLQETRQDVLSVETPEATRWLYGTDATTVPNRELVTHFTFNTPVTDLLPDAGGPVQCGRVVFSSFHVSAAAKKSGGGAPTTFPGICKDEPPTAQEKALIFMLFDLAACVQRDEPPIIN